MQEMKVKYDEMYEMHTDTEKVVGDRIKKVEDNLYMKEEEVSRLKELVYQKETIIRNISGAHEQHKMNIEKLEDEIYYHQSETNKVQSKLEITLESNGG